MTTGDSHGAASGLLIVTMTAMIARPERIAPPQSNGGRDVPRSGCSRLSSRMTMPARNAIPTGTTSIRKSASHGANCRTTPPMIGPEAPPMATAVV